MAESKATRLSDRLLEVAALGDPGAASAADQLIALLDDPSDLIRAQAAASLARIGDPALPAIASAVEGTVAHMGSAEGNAERRLAALDWALVNSSGDPTVMLVRWLERPPLALRPTKDGSATHQRRFQFSDFAHSIIVKRGPRSLHLLRGLLARKSADPDRVIEMVREIGAPAAELIRPIWSRLSRQGDVRAKAEFLADLRPATNARIRRILLSRYGGKNSAELRSMVLGFVGSDSAFADVAVELLAQRNGKLREEALVALAEQASVPDRAVPFLIRRLREGDSSEEALEALGKVGLLSRRHRRSVIALLPNLAPDVRPQIVGALAQAVLRASGSEPEAVAELLAAAQRLLDLRRLIQAAAIVGALGPERGSLVSGRLALRIWASAPEEDQEEVAWLLAPMASGADDLLLAWRKVAAGVGSDGAPDVAEVLPAILLRLGPPGRAGLRAAAQEAEHPCEFLDAIFEQTFDPNLQAFDLAVDRAATLAAADRCADAAALGNAEPEHLRSLLRNEANPAFAGAAAEVVRRVLAKPGDTGGLLLIRDLAALEDSDDLLCSLSDMDPAIQEAVLLGLMDRSAEAPVDFDCRGLVWSSRSSARLVQRLAGDEEFLAEFSDQDEDYLTRFLSRVAAPECPSSGTRCEAVASLLQLAQTGHGPLRVWAASRMPAAVQGADVRRILNAAFKGNDVGLATAAADRLLVIEQGSSQSWAQAALAGISARIAAELSAMHSGEFIGQTASEVAVGAASSSGGGLPTESSNVPNEGAAAISAGEEIVATGSRRALPLFPWPPPSGYVGKVTFGLEVDASLLGPPTATLDSVHRRIVQALQRIDPTFETGLFAAPGGFALMTRLEQVDRDGRPLAGRARWMDLRPPPSSLSDYLMRLFLAPPGFYREIVFLVTDQANFGSSSRPLPSYREGGSILPPLVANTLLRDRHAFALVYAFAKRDGARTVLPFTEVGGAAHLRQAGIFRALAGR